MWVNKLFNDVGRQESVLLRRRVGGKKGDKAPNLPTDFGFVPPLTFSLDEGLDASEM